MPTETNLIIRSLLMLFSVVATGTTKAMDAYRCDNCTEQQILRVAQIKGVSQPEQPFLVFDWVRNQIRMFIVHDATPVSGNDIVRHQTNSGVLASHSILLTELPPSTEARNEFAFIQKALVATQGSMKKEISLTTTSIGMDVGIYDFRLDAGLTQRTLRRLHARYAGDSPAQGLLSELAGTSVGTPNLHWPDIDAPRLYVYLSTADGGRIAFKIVESLSQSGVAGTPLDKHNQELLGWNRHPHASRYMFDRDGNTFSQFRKAAALHSIPVTGTPPSEGDSFEVECRVITGDGSRKLGCAVIEHTTSN